MLGDIHSLTTEMNAYCECLKAPQIVYWDPAEPCPTCGLDLKRNNLKRVVFCETPATNRKKKPSGSFCKKNGHFPIVLYSDCPFRTFAKQIGQFFQLLTKNSSHPMSACWKPVTWLAWVRITESSLHRLTRLFLSTNLKLFAGLQMNILCSLLTQAAFQPWIPLNLNPPLCAVGHCWAFPLLSQCRALRKMNAAFVAALSEHHL